MPTTYPAGYMLLRQGWEFLQLCVVFLRDEKEENLSPCHTNV